MGFTIFIWYMMGGGPALPAQTILWVEPNRGLQWNEPARPLSWTEDARALVWVMS